MMKRMELGDIQKSASILQSKLQQLHGNYCTDTDALKL